MSRLAPALLAVIAIGCADERWVIAELDVPPTRGDLCLVARGGSEPAFVQRYPASEAAGSVTFVEGDEVRGRLFLEAVLSRGGRAVARARAEAEFGTATLPTVLRPGECVASRPSPGTTLGTMEGAEAIVAADTNADGRDELYFDLGESVRGLDGGTLPFDTLVGSADLDADCRFELWGLSGAELGDGGELAIAVDGDQVAFGDAGEGGRFFVGGPTGLGTVTMEGEARALSGAPTLSVAVGDLDGDGYDEVVAGGANGIEVFFGGEGGPRIAPGATPRGWTARQLALGDLDGDGDLDLVTAMEGGLGVARNRGDGFLEAVPVPAAAPSRVVVGDVDGDCVGDLVLVAGEGTPSEWLKGTLDGAPVTGGALGDDVIDAAFGDVGEGPGLIILHADGRVEAPAR